MEEARYLEVANYELGALSRGVLVRCMYSAMDGGLLFAARAALLACIGGLAFLVRVCLR